jgi:deoxyribose-phosphate aldolase
MKNLPKHLSQNIAEARKARATKAVALTALRSLDLTSLNDDDTKESIQELVAKANQKKLGHVAAVCVYPRFLRQAFNAESKDGIGRATVINFPSGKGQSAQTTQDVKKAIASGANEIDIVLDYQSFLRGNAEKAEVLLRACRDACGADVKLKVILESAAFDDYKNLYAASRLALDCGADFLKTSTGKSPKGGASLEAAATMMQAILDADSAAGLKVSGGVKTVGDCAQYESLAKKMMGKDWVSPATFRIGASGVLTDILQRLGKPSAKSAVSPSGY